jgi:hypothetical protein
MSSISWRTPDEFATSSQINLPPSSCQRQGLDLHGGEELFDGGCPPPEPVSQELPSQEVLPKKSAPHAPLEEGELQLSLLRQVATPQAGTNMSDKKRRRPKRLFKSKYSWRKCILRNTVAESKVTEIETADADMPPMKKIRLSAQIKR